MFFQRKIYCNNRPLWITNNARHIMNEEPSANGYMLLHGAFRRNYQLAMEHLSKRRALGVIIEDISVPALKETLYDVFKPIDAGGGIVTNEHGDVLMIYRRGKWDLPKGKRDKGERIAESAIREVKEETGLEEVTLGDKIGKTYHIYTQNGKDYLKRTTWFKMFASEKQKLVPQALENILQVSWIPNDTIHEQLRHSYDAISEILLRAEV